MKIKSLLLIMTLAVTSPVLAAPAASSWKFTVDPALKGGTPAIAGETSGEAAELQYTIKKILPLGVTQDLRTDTLPAAKSMNLCMPVVDEETYMEVAVNEKDSTATLFKWRTLVMPDGKDLMAHRPDPMFAKPADFAKYWDGAKKELAAVKNRKATITRVPAKDTTTGLLHRVDFESVRETTVSAWYYVPKAAYDEKMKVCKQFPAVQIMPGYGAEEPPIDRTADGVIVLSMNPRNHGPSKDFWKSPTEHMMYNIDDPDNYYYKLAFLDCLRAMQFLMARPEVDNKRVGTEGGSQGGLFAIATAALEPRVACVVSNVTAFSSYGNSMRLATVGHHAQFAEMVRDETDETKKAAIMRSLAMTDGANMATLVKVPIQINMGDIDTVCPYVAGIDIFNVVASKEKEYHISPNCPHAVPPDMRGRGTAWQQKYLKLNEPPKAFTPKKPAAQPRKKK